MAVAPLEDGLVMEMLRYANELRDTADFFGEIPKTKPDKEMIELASQLIEKKSGPFDPEKFQDHYATALRELVQEKLKGHKIIAPHEDTRPQGSNVVDLMEALKRSIGQSGGGSTKAQPAAKAKAPAKKPKKRA